MNLSNQRISNEVNAAIALHAGEISRNLLSGAFYSLFHVERESEIAEPTVFTSDSDPAGLETRRMDYLHFRHLPLFLSNEELLQRRFTAYTDYEFVLIVDVTRSLTQGWLSALDAGEE